MVQRLYACTLLSDTYYYFSFICWLFQVLTNEDEAEKQVVQSLSLATQDYPVTVVAPAPTCMPVAKGQESDGIYFARPVDLNGSASTPSG